MLNFFLTSNFEVTVDLELPQRTHAVYTWCRGVRLVCSGVGIAGGRLLEGRRTVHNTQVQHGVFKWPTTTGSDGKLCRTMLIGVWIQPIGHMLSSSSARLTNCSKWEKDQKKHTKKRERKRTEIATVVYVSQRNCRCAPCPSACASPHARTPALTCICVCLPVAVHTTVILTLHTLQDRWMASAAALPGKDGPSGK